MNKIVLLGAMFALGTFSAHAADLAAEAAPAPVKVTPGFSGYVEVNGTDMDFYDGRWPGFGGAAALAYRLDDNWQIEAELNAQTASSDAYSGEYSQSTSLAALHLNYYGDAFAIGAFAGVSAMTEYWNYGVVYSGVGGVEGQISLTDNIVAGAQAGYVKSFSAYYQDEPLGAAFAQADVRFFPTDNIKLQASVGLAKGETWNDDDIDLVTWGVEGEYQFDSSPLSVFASYGQSTDNYYNYDSSTVKVGARFSFDGESLKDQAKTGASHKVMDLSPIEGIRWY